MMSSVFVHYDISTQPSTCGICDRRLIEFVAKSIAKFDTSTHIDRRLRDSECDIVCETRNPTDLKNHLPVSLKVTGEREYIRSYRTPEVLIHQCR